MRTQTNWSKAISKQKIREWLKNNYELRGEWIVDLIDQYTKDQSAWNEERTTLLQAVRFYAEQADYSESWKIDSSFHVMEDRGAVARNALFQIDVLPPTQEG